MPDALPIGTSWWELIEARAAATPDPRTGERACAVVVLAAGHDSITIPEIATFCRERGLSTTKIPEQIELVATLPRNPMGKVLEHVLRSEVATS